MTDRPHGWPRKLTDAQAQEIREWYALRTATPSGAEIARKHGVDTSTVYKIGQGLTYKQRSARG